MIAGAEIHICEIASLDREWVRRQTILAWGDEIVVVGGRILSPWKLPGFIARGESEEELGWITYSISGTELEIVTINSLREGLGVGSALLGRVLFTAQATGCSRICVTTTNDNQQAMAFYQGRGFRLAAVRPGAVNRAREIKPSIPTHSAEGIPIQDEWEYELILPRRS